MPGLALKLAVVHRVDTGNIVTIGDLEIPPGFQFLG